MTIWTESEAIADDLAPIRRQLLDLLDASDAVANASTYRSPEYIAATHRGRILIAALNALNEA